MGLEGVEPEEIPPVTRVTRTTKAASMEAGGGAVGERITVSTEAAAAVVEVSTSVTTVDLMLAWRGSSNSNSSSTRIRGSNRGGGWQVVAVGMKGIGGGVASTMVSVFMCCHASAVYNTGGGRGERGCFVFGDGGVGLWNDFVFVVGWMVTGTNGWVDTPGFASLLFFVCAIGGREGFYSTKRLFF